MPTEKLDAKQILLVSILAKLNEHQVEYAVVHPGESNLPDVDSDVDLIFGEDPRQLLDRAIPELSVNSDIQLVQKLYYEVFCGYYYIISIRTQQGYTFLHLDCLYDPFGINRYHLPTSYLLQNRIQTAYGYRCSPAREAEYLLIKRIIKNSWTATKINEIQCLFKKEEPERHAIKLKWLGSKGEKLFSKFVRGEQHLSDEAATSKLKQRLEFKFATNHFFRWLVRQAMTLARNLSRMFRPTGFFVAIIGPDGAGKSTISTAIQENLSRGFRNVWHFHWRPKLFPKLGRTKTASTNTDSVAPPEKSQYTGVVSLLRFLYYWMDFVVGYWFVIYPKRSRSTLIIGERYFPDVIVHPERYGFSVPEWLMRLAAVAVPSADMIILLKDSPEAIFKRKPELPVSKIRSQIERYEKELPHWHAPKIIETSSGVQETSDTGISLIVDACNKRIYP